MFDQPDALLLARIQFAFTISFHFIFPAFSIGLASYLAVLEGMWLKTGKSVYLDLFSYWLKIFAVAFAMGVVSGIVMSYQFGTNWSVFSDKAGPVIGPLMAYEVLTAFFLEAGFLGVMLFGMSKVGKRLHFGATLMVALGTFISAFWIIAVNSWMQTPTGYAINAAGQFVSAGNWLAIIFSPSLPYRLVHTLLAAYLTTALVVGAVGAWHLLKDRANAHARTMFSMAMWMAAIVAPIQIVAGDQHGLNTLQFQPAKVMAMEGHYDSHAHGAPLILFGIPNSSTRRIDYAVQIPGGASLILKHDPKAPLAGLDVIARDKQPPVGVMFWSFRVMVGLGLGMLGLGALSLLARLRGRLYEWRPLHRLALAMGPAGFVAVIAGWITTEVGRQLYTIYGLLTTAQSASPLAAPAVATSLVAFVLVYFAVFGAGTWYILRLMGRARDEGAQKGGSQPTAAELRKQALDSLIEERVLVTYARDNGVKVDDAEVERAIANIASGNKMTLAQLRERLGLQGIDYATFKSGIRDQITIERIREREVVSHIRVTDGEINDYIAKLRNGRSTAPQVNLAQILVSVPDNATGAVFAERQARAEQALARVNNGEPFEQVAREMSEDSNKAKGGEMGARPLDRYPDLFSKAIDGVKVGGVTPKLVRSGAGFHILKVLSRGEDSGLTIAQTRVRHIVLRPSAELGLDAAERRLNDFRQQIMDGTKRFEEIATQYSEDGSAAQGGDMGWASPGQFVPEFEAAMDKLPVGGLSLPVRSRFGVHLIQVLERRDSTLDPKQVREQAVNALRETKFEPAYAEWVADLRAKAFIEYRESPQ